MPTLITLLLCLGLQSLLGNTVSGRPATGFGHISFPNMLVVNASASASASASAKISSTSSVETHPNATAGTEIGSSGTLTMPGLAPPKTCVCQDSASSPLPAHGVAGTVSPNTTSPADSAPDTAAPSPSTSYPSDSPSDLNATTSDAPAENSSNNSSATPSPSGAPNASATPGQETPGAASALLVTDFSRAFPLLMSIAVGLTLLYV
ncbi:hypothetical protein CROQUDRAFT_657976 [Cronartium quercuum f. sp. fusiforme G11]|uniref:Uncharacterized protein n=1 Tax=Cronartium quercuum f. sp. fusiforme G11 TaxID=708437 RepID=A0A9P6TBV0_9BASI|nr:hypothetical protein CROQUDRAFT_657976 [Cronartium quercuum f. sp. fusiforme G11]